MAISDKQVHAGVSGRFRGGDDSLRGDAAKSEQAFRTISEVAAMLDIAPHVLRFWESRFPQIRPVKRRGGRRYYRPEDVELLQKVKTLLHTQGYTIRGASRLFEKRQREALAESLSESAALPLSKGDNRQQGLFDEPATSTYKQTSDAEIKRLLGDLERMKRQLDDMLPDPL